MRLTVCCLALSISCCLFLGCSGRPKRVKAPKVNPGRSADLAIETYDTNQDGQLDPEELLKCPGILGKFEIYDSDKSGGVSQGEIAERIGYRRERRVGLQRIQAKVQLNGRPLPGAEVVFEPEPYLGDEVKAAYGTTNKGGLAPMAIPDEELPENQRGMKALHMGTYKVRITHPELDIPPKYNVDTELGYETEIGATYANFDLKMNMRKKK